MLQQIVSALVTVVIGIAAALLYFYASNKLLDLVFSSRGKGPDAARNQKIASSIRPWLFLGPALLGDLQALAQRRPHVAPRRLHRVGRRLSVPPRVRGSAAHAWHPAPRR